MKKLNIVYIDINVPIPSEYNPRTSTKFQEEKLDESIGEFDIVQPLILNSAPNRKNKIISGHFRWREAQKLGFKKIPVVHLSIPDIDKEKRLNLTLNRVSGDWDYELLKSFKIETLLESGFDDFDLTHIFDEVLSVQNDDFNLGHEISKIKKPKTKPGDLIILGNHRLSCSDSLNPKAINKLVGDHKINMLNYDPIYNIGLDYNKGVGTQGKYGGKVNDKKSDSEYREFLKTALQNGLDHCLPDAHIFCWCDEKYMGMLQSLYSELGISNKRVCLWIKNNSSPTPQVAFSKVFEACVYGTTGSPYLSSSVRNLNEIMNEEVGTGNRLIDDILDLFNIWLVKRLSSQDYEHPTQKPPTLYEKAFRRCSRPGDIILDLFGGSGSQLVAAEQLKRRVFLSEIEPIFCDVIVSRYEKLAKRKAVYVNS
ncbi:MAG: DNA modification methylase [Candidatus Pacebacteria bacterium]|nr:DNA modification methylase [Candidatus Paceibacterota bacterium]